MKKDPLAIALLGVLFVSTLATAGMCYWYLRSVRDMRQVQAQYNSMSFNQQLVRPLAVDLNNYATQNPAILPLLDQINLRARAARATNNTNGPGGAP